MTNTSATSLVARLKDNDRLAMKEVFQTYYGSVCGTIHRVLKDEASSKDVAQKVFIKFWEKREQLNISSSLKAYLHRMAFNEAISFIRANKKHQHDEIQSFHSGVSDSSDQLLLNQELAIQIQDAISTLPPRCQTIFQLSRYEELTYREISERLEISIKTVENQMGKALKILREQLAPYLKQT